MLPQLPAGLIYSALVFYLVGLLGSFLVFWLVYLVSTANSIACTLLVSAISPNTSVAGAFMSSYATTLFFFSGYLITYSSIPVYWQWYSTIDYLRYSFGSMMANQFSESTSAEAAVPAAAGAGNALKFYDLEGVNKWTWLGYQALFFPVFTICLWAALKWLQHTKR
jgi:ABC-type multidrug transport system permease subunit